MKVFPVSIYDSDDPWGDGKTIGIFSNKERAVESANHYIKQQDNDKLHLIVGEQTIDQYYIDNLTPLARALEEK